VITGPTATGKTALGVRLAKIIDGEIVSADSMQVYKHMDIGTAKPASTEMQGIRHHMVDCVSPLESYSAARYVKDASKCIDDILRRKKQPIIVGGTGLYIDSLLAGRGFSPIGDSALRRNLEAEYDDIGGEAMLQKLQAADADSAAVLHENDKKRIVRALEIYLSTGKTISHHNAESRLLPPRYDAKKIALTFADRARLYAGIDDRVDKMLASGLEAEVKALLCMGVERGSTAMQAIGYKEIASAIVDKTDMALAIEKVKMESRRFAKRQLTWLRRDDSLKWIIWEDSPDLDSAAANILTQ